MRRLSLPAILLAAFLSVSAGAQAASDTPLVVSSGVSVTFGGISYTWAPGDYSSCYVGPTSSNCTGLVGYCPGGCPQGGNGQPGGGPGPTSSATTTAQSTNGSAIGGGEGFIPIIQTTTTNGAGGVVIVPDYTGIGIVLIVATIGTLTALGVLRDDPTFRRAENRAKADFRRPARGTNIFRRPKKKR